MENASLRDRETTEDVLNLVERMSKAESLWELCDLAYLFLGNPIFVSDTFRTIMAYTKTADVDAPEWKDCVVDGNIDARTMYESKQVRDVHEGSIKLNHPVLVEDDQSSVPRMVRSIDNKGKMIGVVVASSYHKPFDAGDMTRLEVVSSLVKAVMERNLLSAGDYGKSVSHYLYALLDGVSVSVKSHNHRMNALGVKIMPAYYILVIAASKNRASDISMKDLIGRASDILKCPVIRFREQVVCFFGVGKKTPDWKKEMPGLTDMLSECNLSAGVSRRFSGLFDAREHYREAAYALDLGRELGREALLFFYDNLSYYHMFRSLATQIDAYCNEKIRGLDEYDRSHNTDLCGTLRVFLEHSKSLSKTAEIAFVHKNTVRYRVEKCMDLLGSDLEDEDEIFSFLLSLRIVEYRRKFTERGV
jgi:hypothetical protein